MSKHARAWLDDWIRSNVLAQSSSLGELADTMRKCMEDAAQDGFSKSDVEQAAGGNLPAFIHEAIVRSAGG